MFVDIELPPRVLSPRAEALLPGHLAAQQILTGVENLSTGYVHVVRGEHVLQATLRENRIVHVSRRVVVLVPNPLVTALLHAVRREAAKKLCAVTPSAVQPLLHPIHHHLLDL